jgi:hypothetical protein
MFTKPLKCCFSDSLDTWQTYIAAIRAQNIEQDYILLQFWPYEESGLGEKQKIDVEITVDSSDTCSSLQECVEECVEEYLNIRNCVVGIRTKNHFMKGQLCAEALDSFCEVTYLIATPSQVINFKGVGAEELTENLLNRR